MTARILAIAAALVCGVIVACAGLGGVLLTGGSAAANCVPGPAGSGTPSRPSGPTAPPSGPLPAIDQWDPVQVGNAATIISVGVARALPARAWVIAVATAMQESSLRNLPGGDRDSVGLFQQRPSQGWGTVAQLTDSVYAAGKFYDKLVTIPNWQTLPLTEAAQAVQISAFPDAYTRWEPDAVTIVQTLTGQAGGVAACNISISGQGWTQPVQAHVGSGFRTADRPTHDGVDLIAARGTPIHAASAGTVSRVRCNAADRNTRQPWGCDRDGDPNQTVGCGWYVDIDHPGGVVTRYCHMLTQPLVREGQTVAAGEVIGIVGSSGHSSSPHLHYEVHISGDGSHDHSLDSAKDPVWFMVLVDAPLDVADHWPPNNDIAGHRSFAEPT
ncbi:M23 family metallopeptidase [Dactylosporangium cerinum]|uniref:M23 family metallopeptidase n=1 Tax=Dactylosporangium cerinum TaxID=1434730 RepID=A0ABV9WEP3_9ACTN